MKLSTAAVVINCVMWFAVSAAVIVALILTQRIEVFWVYLIPAISTYSITNIQRGEKDEDKGNI